ncbi:radical SAM protein [Vallitalea pronyensis]|uniref:Radical SAM protein n=1 Tax=Vallitalea pronyensis TaxID=1348613 RepID=A0A8J8MHQ5_9FIRM|nr:radical SAM protein [Vallitalea pronyensis]QUI21860.1 radical SAM protein [Vallitalea pronyensis]
MKVALINPKATIFSKEKEMTKFLKESITMGSFRHFWSAPCLGLLTIAAYFPTDWEVVYIDENYMDIDFSQLYDMVCVSAMTIQATRAYEIADIFKRKNTITVMGGIHATVLPHEAKQYVDVVIAGEGEVLFPQFIHDYIHHQHKDIYQEAHVGTFDMKHCIVPRYDLIRDYDYPVINVYTTRGCPRKCNFCCASNVYGLKYRRKSNHQILQEIEIIEKMYPDKLILFADDNLFVLRQKSKALLQSLIPKNLRWIAQTDITIADDEDLLELMIASGCQWVVIGFESVSEESLKNIESKTFKYEYLHHYAEKIKKIQSYGIGVYGTFIIGLDGDTSDVFDKTADFINDNHLYGANITVPTPLPGTEIRKQLEKEKRIISYEWHDYTLWDVVIEPKQMEIKALKEGLLYTYKKITHQKNANERLRYLIKNMRYKKRSKHIDTR